MESNRLRQAACLAVISFFLVALFSHNAFAQYPGYPPGFNPYAPQVSEWQLFTQRILPILIGAVAGGIIGAFFSPLLSKFRLYLKFALAGVVVLYGLFGPGVGGNVVDYLTACVAFCVACVFASQLGAKFQRSGSLSRATSLGSAQWATIEHLTENGVIGNEGFFLGSFTHRRQRGPAPSLQYTGQRHLLTVAPTRSGKGVSSIIPNLLTYSGSAFIIDPKGENALITAHRRGKGSGSIPGMGQNVCLFDPWNIAAGKLGIKASSFNPLDWITKDDPDSAENAFLLSDALVLSEGTGEARFWDEEARALLVAIILFVATDESEKQERTLGRVRDILNLGDDQFKAVLQKMYKHSHPLVRGGAARQASKDTKLFSSVLTTAQSHTHFLDSPRIRESLARTDVRFEDLKTKPTSVYLILPADRLKTFDRWLRLLIQQAITVNARNIEVRPAKPVLFLLDEMSTLGKLPALEQAFGLMAGFGIQLWGIVQDLSQLAKVYGEHGWQTFISNSGVIQYFGSRDTMTAEYFSKLCGVTTIELKSFSTVIGHAISRASSFTSSLTGGGSSSNSTTNSENWGRTQGFNEAQRQLAYPDELMVMRDHRQIIFVENLDPIPADKMVWYRDTKLKQLGVDLHSKALLSAAPASPTLAPVIGPAQQVQV